MCFTHPKIGKPNRGERHGAAWGERLAVLVLVLGANIALAQELYRDERHAPLSPRISAELNNELLQARQGL